MNYFLRRKVFSPVSMFFFVAACWLPAGSVYASVCTVVSSSDIQFGTINSFSTGTDLLAQGTITYKCSNSTGQPLAVRLCVSIDGNGYTPNLKSRYLTSATGAKLEYNLYTSSAMDVIWGARIGGNGNLQYQMDFMLLSVLDLHKTLTVYGKIEPNQTVEEGNYKAIHYGNGTNTLNSMEASTIATLPHCGPANPTNERFSFTDLTLVDNTCIVSAKDIQIGSTSGVFFQELNLKGEGEINVKCNNGTPYLVRLSPSNNDSTGAGQMTDKNNAANTKPIAYQLRQQPGNSGKIWGSEGDLIDTMNSLKKTGSGALDSIPVYVTVPSVNVPAGIYSDTVRVNITY